VRDVVGLRNDLTWESLTFCANHQDFGAGHDICGSGSPKNVQGRAGPGYDGVAGVVRFAGTGGGAAGRDPAAKLVVVQEVARSGNSVVSRFVSADGKL